MRNSYHGRSYATMGITGHRSWSASAHNPLQVAWLHSGERLRGLLARLPDADRIDAAVEDLREVLATQTSGDVACLIAEPIQGVGGFVHPPDGLFAAWRKVLDEHGILLISDEVQTGWGRTGEHFWGYQAHGVTPDLLTFAKGIGNGFALAGVVGRADIMESVPAISFSTFGGNPLCHRRRQRGPGLPARPRPPGQRGPGRRDPARRPAGHGRRPRRRRRGAGQGTDARRGVRPARGLEPDPAPTARVFEACRAGGLLVGKGGLYGNVLRMGPPLTLTEDEAREGLAILVEAIRSAVAAEAAR